MTFNENLESYEINLLGFPYKIKLCDDLLDKFNVAGVTSVYTGEMDLDSTISRNDLISTLLHESIEIMFRKLEMQVEHDVISKIEVMLFDYLSRNKDLWKFLLRSIQSEKKKENSRTKGGSIKIKRVEKGNKSESK